MTRLSLSPFSFLVTLQYYPFNKEDVNQAHTQLPSQNKIPHELAPSKIVIIPHFRIDTPLPFYQRVQHGMLGCALVTDTHFMGIGIIINKHLG